MPVIEDQRQGLLADVDVDPLRMQPARHDLLADFQRIVAPQQHPFVRSQCRHPRPNSRNRLPPKRSAKLATSIPAMLAITASSCIEFALLPYGRSEP